MTANVTHPGRSRGHRERWEFSFLRLNERIWRSLPSSICDRPPVRDYGTWLHRRVCLRADREMYLGTLFLRNRPALELMRRIVARQDRGATVKVAVLGCSIGVEVYSILWTLRSARPDLEIVVEAVDISPEVIRIGEHGAYSPEASEIVHASIFEGLTHREREGMFDWHGNCGQIKTWLRDGITWRVGDASDPKLVTDLGAQDLVVANNFLCHMPATDARRCLRNFARLVSPGGHLIVAGVDLDVRTQVALELGWKPVPELRAEIHDGDPLVRADWPWRWWGLEPFDPRHRDWETRYAAVFRVAAQP
jgi:chemotaxis protein methyltransferase CheR